jgi:membrane protease YdiL (CAAX protease family)
MGRSSGVRPLAHAAAAYLLLVLGVTPLGFYVVFPLAARWLSAHPPGSPWVAAVAGRLPQYAIYAFICFFFYVVVARPLRLRPVFGGSNSPRRTAAVAGCALGAVLLTTPLGVWATPSAIGLLTFLITGVSEEWVFRGLLTRVVADRAGIVWAAVVVSASFALWHWGEILFVDRQRLLSAGWFAALAADFAFGLIFTVVVWRSRSLLWGGLVHGLADWHPWLGSPRFWIQAWHVPTAVLVYGLALAGAETIRRLSPPVVPPSGT